MPLSDLPRCPLAWHWATVASKWLCRMQEPPSRFVSFSPPDSSCPPSPLNPQLSQFPNSMILSSSFFLCFGVVVVVVFLLLSRPLLLSSLLFAGLIFGWGGWGWGWNREKKKIQGAGRGYICSFMTNHMCFWVFVFTCFSWKRGWWNGMTGEERQAYGSCLLS